MEIEQVVIDTLYLRYKDKGFVTEDEILDICTEYNLPFHQIDYVCDQVISRGVLISDNSLKQTELDDEITDYAQIDYESVYRKALYICPNMKTIIDKIRMITPPQKGEIKGLIVQSRSGNKFAREKLIKMYLRMVLRIALQYIDRTTLPVEDLFSVGCLGLIKAVDSYDEQNNSYFTSYSSLWIRQHIDRYIMDKEALIRLPVYQQSKSDAIEVSSLDQMFDNDDDLDFYDNYDIYEISEHHLLKELMQKALSTLPEKEAQIIKLRFGLFDNNEYTLEDVGLMFNVTRERIRQLETKALRKMKHPTRARFIRDFY